MKWHPHVKFAMPGVIALFFVAVFQEFIPPYLRPWAFASVALTLILGLATGQFHRTAKEQKEEAKRDIPGHVPDKDDKAE